MRLARSPASGNFISHLVRRIFLCRPAPGERLRLRSSSGLAGGGDPFNEGAGAADSRSGLQHPRQSGDYAAGSGTDQRRNADSLAAAWSAGDAAADASGTGRAVFDASYSGRAPVPIRCRCFEDRRNCGCWWRIQARIRPISWRRYGGRRDSTVRMAERILRN